MDSFATSLPHASICALALCCKGEDCTSGHDLQSRTEIRAKSASFQPLSTLDSRAERGLLCTRHARIQFLHFWILCLRRGQQGWAAASTVQRGSTLLQDAPPTFKNVDSVTRTALMAGARQLVAPRKQSAASSAESTTLTATPSACGNGTTARRQQGQTAFARSMVPTGSVYLESAAQVHTEIATGTA